MLDIGTISLPVICKWSPQFISAWSNNDSSLVLSFCRHKDWKTWFPLVKQELQKSNGRFEVSKLSLKVGKTKYFFLKKPSKKDDLPFLLLKLLIKKNKQERVKF